MENYPITTNMEKTDEPRQKNADKYLKTLVRKLSNSQMLNLKTNYTVFYHHIVKPWDTFLAAICVIHQYCVFSHILLMEVNKLLVDNNRKDTRRLKNLQQNLTRLTKCLDEISLHYSKFAFRKEKIKKIKKVVKKIRNDIRKLPEINHLYDLKLTKDDILCSVLGLKREVACRLHDLSHYIRKHKSDKKNLLQLLKEFEEDDSINNLRNSNDVAVILQRIGFTKHRSDFIANWIVNMDDPDHKSILSWVEIYIENHFQYDTVLNDKVLDFPYKQHRLDKWFQESVSRFDEEGNSHPHSVNIINVKSQEDARQQIEKIEIKVWQSNPGMEVYFHCTDHKSAENILENSIHLGYSREKSDFSDGEGFYVANDVQYVLKQHGTTSSHIAILMFDMTPTKQSKFKEMNLSSSEKIEDWKSIVQYFRSGKKNVNNLSQSLRSQIRNCDYIRGRVSCRGASLNCANNSVEQICIKSQELADLIGYPSSILGVLFIEAQSGWMNNFSESSKNQSLNWDSADKYSSNNNDSGFSEIQSSSNSSSNNSSDSHSCDIQFYYADASYSL
ncbi:uncharacterized protein LOC124451062 [Xenia sp. Carnegie-2017]|uniref:uncharacterized protein LOC124451062 n=1 Tax=Xenia sp. Carnegie-2017 TaxID=2897299 RepID=UPI001F0415FA|nr:uncharacterized protein LOC124451062 [Xenia sp. Carnegie-2017]